MGKTTFWFSLIGTVIAVASLPIMLMYSPFIGLLFLLFGAYLYGGVPTQKETSKWFKHYGMISFIGVALIVYVYASGGLSEIEKIFKNSVVIVVIGGIFLSPLVKKLMSNK